jgi:hypothetical protein
MVGRTQPLGRHLNFILAQFGKDALHFVVLFVAGVAGKKVVVMVWFRVFAQLMYLDICV